MLARIVQQGEARASSAPARATEVARRAVSILFSAPTRRRPTVFRAARAGTIDFDEVVRTLEAYPAAGDRILGLPAGSFPVPDPSILRQWFG